MLILTAIPVSRVAAALGGVAAMWQIAWLAMALAEDLLNMRAAASF
jgi:hypothetical protein